MWTLRLSLRYSYVSDFPIGVQDNCSLCAQMIICVAFDVGDTLYYGLDYKSGLTAAN